MVTIVFKGIMVVTEISGKKPSKEATGMRAEWLQANPFVQYQADAGMHHTGQHTNQAITNHQTQQLLIGFQQTRPAG